MTTISEVCKHLGTKFKTIELISFYSKKQELSICQNKTKENINIEAFKFILGNALSESSKDFEDNNDIIVDYGQKGSMAFYQFKEKSWLIVSADKKSFPLINLEITKLNRDDIAIDLLDSQKFKKAIKKENVNEEESSVAYNNYKKLSQSNLPDLSVLSKHFARHFSYFSPKGRISNDTYWIKDTPKSLYIAVADCNSKESKEISAIHKLLSCRINKNPAISLQLIHEDLAMTEKKMPESASSIEELAICRYDKMTGDIHIATSGIPVLYIENEKSYNLIKIKGKQNVGNANLKIESIKLNMNKGDKVILFSDGLTNQTSDSTNKKLSNRGVKKMFMSMKADLSKEVFEREFLKWRGKSKQIDDITVLAFQI